MLRRGSGRNFGAGLAIAGLALVACLTVPLPAVAQDDGVGPPIGGVEPGQQPAPPATSADLPASTIPASPGDQPDVQSEIVTIDQEMLFTNSIWGKRTQARLDEEGQRLEAENERLVTQLSNEEAQLTEERATLDPAEFRRRAEAFDVRATQVRRERLQAVQDVNGWAAADRAAFYRAALPLMGEVMRERGAVAVLDRRTVFVSLEAIDITNDLAALLDERLGDGDGVVPFVPGQSNGGAPTEDAGAPSPEMVPEQPEQ
ncbi:OmpH family outer membrane protein [Paracoccus caeni]|uniref:OmpH family outer membrane protein n=1 Tax=Paracoccus caeni TaxID=657651 RepID=A0A934SGF2_9RHOB|nr:OmpH family outer membrane protein [Paracoccus caeni]MBK4216970.1 OmpH family outer membrane protein [Paracoccus caeni]